jgi:hypothetical protein
MAQGRKTGGRSKGVPNKCTAEIKAALAQLFTPAYFASLPQRLKDGKLAPQIEAKLLAYCYGEPKQFLEHSGPDGGPIKIHHHYAAAPPAGV